MALIEKTYLYRIRILHNSDGDVTLVETVTRTAIFRDGAELPGATETVDVFPAEKLGPQVASLLASMNAAKAEAEEEAAEAVRKAAKKAAKEAAKKAAEAEKAAKVEEEEEDA